MIRFLNFVSIIVAFVILAFGVFNYVNRDHTTIYVGVDGYSAPFSMISDIGDLKGFGVDLMRAVANALDVNVEFRNRGFAKAALLKVIKYSHRVIHLAQIYAIIRNDNKISINLFNSLGFSIKTQLDGWLFDGEKYNDAILMQFFLEKTH